jgi:hypothetical protein
VGIINPQYGCVLLGKEPREIQGWREALYSSFLPRYDCQRYCRSDPHRQEGKKIQYEDEGLEYYRTSSPRRKPELRSPYEPHRPKQEGWDARGCSSTSRVATAPRRDGI